MLIRDLDIIMSRRKQAKPQYVQSDSTLSEHIGGTQLVLETPYIFHFRAHVCNGCCAEFDELSDLELHVRDCAPDQLVLIVNDDSASSAETFSSELSSREPDEMASTFEMEECSDLSEEKSDRTEHAMDVFGCKRSQSHLKSPCSSMSWSGPTDSTTDMVAHTSVHPTSILQPGNNPSEQHGKSSCFNSNVIIENLESTKVAVAQFSQQSRLDTRSSDSSKIAISSLMEQLLALQLQQIHQLQLIDQIRHQVLIFASQRFEVSETLTQSPTSSHQGSLASTYASQVTTLSSHLSQQLAAAAGLAHCLASQSASVDHFDQLITTEQLPDRPLGSSEPLQSMGKGMIPAVSMHDSGTKYTQNSSPYPTLHFKSQIKMSSSTLATSSSLNPSNNTHLPRPPASNQTFSKAGLNIGAIVEDPNGLTALAQQRKGKPSNGTSVKHKMSLEEAFLKHKCRFCAKIFGSDSALQIHLRSHTGERPYKCNICGNRFSTRGNLKVHFQRHKERYPHIQMNPYPVPEHLDNIRTSTGIPRGMSMPPEKAITSWLDSKPSLTILTPVGMLLPTGPPNLPFLIKKEEPSISITTPPTPVVSETSSAVKSTMSMDFVEAAKFPTHRILNPKTDNATHLFSNASKISSITEGPDIHSISTNPIKSEQFRTKHSFGVGVVNSTQTETSKLQQLVENIDKKVTDPNECVICHRTLSCQSALSMHYRTHTGERPFPCKVCGRAFSTKGNLKTHHTVHRVMSSLRVQHSCPICHRKFTNAVVLQQHIHMHMGDQIPNSPITEIESGRRSMDDKKLEENLSDKDDDMDCDDSGIAGMFRFTNSSSGTLSPSPFYSTRAGSFDAQVMANSNSPVEERQRSQPHHLDAHPSSIIATLVGKPSHPPVPCKFMRGLTLGKSLLPAQFVDGHSPPKEISRFTWELTCGVMPSRDEDGDCQWKDHWRLWKLILLSYQKLLRS
ncbi:hypothetical protein UPYG_G00269010 [Umbra pygmaea]|uniref:C2H2-type domain-containing protein n=1 Tax=Umbra pygmaea TaxID=75934 RepID=A0ABD0WFC5_UMBPY